MRNTLINVGLLIFSIAIVLGGLETTLRVTGLMQMGPHPPMIYRTSIHPDISYELVPNIERDAYRSTVKTNSLGLRSPELDPSRPVFVVLGDSITFGYGVENDETLPARLEAILPIFQFLNAGVPGYHLGQETALYREKLSPLHPAGIIVVFHPNDMNMSTGWLDEDGVLRAEGDDPAERPALRCDPIKDGILGKLPGRCWLDRHSAIYVAMKKIVRLRSSREALIDEQQKSKQQPDIDSITDEQIEAYGEQLQQLSTLLDTEIERLFVIWPDRELHAVSRPKIAALAESHGFTVVDLYETFGNDAKTLSWDTVHSHPETIAQAAAVIAESIEP